MIINFILKLFLLYEHMIMLNVTRQVCLLGLFKTVFFWSSRHSFFGVKIQYKILSITKNKMFRDIYHRTFFIF